MEIGLRRNRVTLAAVQAVLAYEWLVSGLTKIVRGDFVPGLAGELRDRAAHASSWYGGFLRDVVVPHAAAFGWAIELGELAIALLLLAGSALALAGRGREAAASTALGALGGLVLAVNFGLSDRVGFLPLVSSGSLDEGIPLDALAAWLHAVLLGSALLALRPARPRAALAHVFAALG